MRQPSLKTRTTRTRTRAAGDLITIGGGLLLGALLGVLWYRLSGSGSTLDRSSGDLATVLPLAAWFPRVSLHDFTQRSLMIPNVSERIQTIARSTALAAAAVLTLIILMARPLSHYLGGHH
ncbi:MAG TPA: hypothetical protein VGZ22_08740 [Isosphaeraceae bacterium]|jgi:hypothetical protein|nr:hypothetical protein [Isosphaeraceae bacterium]